MLELPWAPGPSTPTTEPVVVMASRLELAQYRHVPAFLIASLRLRRALRSAPGALGLGLAAAPGSRTFWTLSIWRGQEELRAYAASPLHRRVMSRFAPRMAASTFVDWAASGEHVPSWEEARQRLTPLPDAPSGASDVQPSS